MADDRESPSGGWREVYDAMEADADIEEATHRCPDCGRTCENVAGAVYECEEHDLFRVSGGDGGEAPEGESDHEAGSGGPTDAERGDGGAPDESDAAHRARGPAD